MSSYVVLERAEIDFLEISLYIEERNRTAALKWEKAIVAILHGARDLGAELFGRRGDRAPEF